MSEFLERLASRNVLVADGATGTNLQQVGLAAGQHAEEWVLDHPDRILNLEKAFVDAGADIILTCTFGGTSIRMQDSKHAERVAEVNRQAALLARDAASTGADVLVAGSMGPLGKLLKPFGPLAQDEARAAYAQQAKVLSDASVDLLVIETQFSLEEAQAALEGAQATTDLPVVVSFSYDQGTRTMMGVKPTDVAAKFVALGAALIGVNCGTTLANAETVLQEYAESAADTRLWA
jgi:5-methyltetrahydrofolate--homocysteine methyltransferase